MTARRSPVRRASVAVATVVAAAVVLTACGSDDDSGHSGHKAGASASASASASADASADVSAGAHNAQDTAFAQGMIPHHRQAVAMAGLAPSRAESQEVKDLAEAIEKAQDPEITTMTGWLEAWGEDVPAEDMPEEMPGMDHSGGDMSGMMSDADMKQLEKLSGTAFDTAFLEMMVAHHEGAVEIAKTERAKGAYGPAKDMAKSVITSQSAEITRMNELLGK